MAHYAILDQNNVVVQVITGRDEDDLADGVESWEDYYSNVHGGLRCLRTSRSTKGNKHYDLSTGLEDEVPPFRKNYAMIGGTYSDELEGFIPEQNYPSWHLNEETCLWEPPIPMPDDGNYYTWNEEVINWKLNAPPSGGEEAPDVEFNVIP